MKIKEAYKKIRYAMRTGFLFLMAITALSCSNTDFEYASERCYLVFNNAIHQDETLQSALNPMSPGIFCRIWEGSEDGSVFFYFASNQGLNSKKKAVGEDLRRTRVIGLYNKTGIIVGYGNLSQPAELFAYDSQCRNCYEEKGTMDNLLTIDTKGFATCPKCKRRYDLNNRGITDNGKPLLRYRATCTGALGVLTVNN